MATTCIATSSGSRRSRRVTLGEPRFPAGKIKEDEYFGKMETYRHEVAIRVPVSTSSGESEVTLQAISQGCADAGLCYSPFKQSARLVLAVADTAAGASKTDSGGAMSKLRALTRSSGEEEFLPVEKAFKIDAKVVDAQTVAVEFKPEQTYYLYRDKIAFELPKDARIAITKVDLPHGEMKSDPNFGDTEVFHGLVQALVTLDRTAARADTQLPLIARYQGCSEKGLCYPPSKKSFDLTLAAWKPDASPASSAQAPSTRAEPAAASPLPAQARKCQPRSQACAAKIRERGSGQPAALRQLLADRRHLLRRRHLARASRPASCRWCRSFPESSSDKDTRPNAARRSR